MKTSILIIMKQTILEIGCGQGFKAYCLSKKGNVIAIDISTKDINIAKERYPKVNFIVMNIENLEFENNSFDKVYGMDVLEHVDNLDAVLNEIARVLKSSGQFIVNIPYWKSEEWLLGIRPTYFEEIHHVRIFGENELEKILENQGFCLCEKKRTGFLSHVEHYFMFKRKIRNQTQIGIGNWRDNCTSKIIHIISLFFDIEILKTHLKYLPIWVITLPIGTVINYFGNIYFPKSLFYKFKKY